MNENSTTSDNTTQPRRPFFNSAAEGFRKARQDAEQTARETLPKFQSLCGQVAYDVSYLAGFGTFFPLTLLRELLPERVKTGFSKGAQRGKETAQTVSQPADSSEGAPAAAI